MICRLERAGLVQEGETQLVQGTKGSRGRSKSRRDTLSHKHLRSGIHLPKALISEIFKLTT